MRPWTSVVFLLLIASVARAEDGPQKVITIEGVTEYRLANGTRVLLFPEESQATVTVNMTVLVGSRQEGYGEAGMAHLLEHMVFKGTPTFPNVPKALRDHGASFNGTTNVDRTNYFETLRASDENLEFAIKLEADRLVHSFIKREDLASEMTVVRNEFERGENSPQNVLRERIDAAAYHWHNYGKSTIGNRTDIERVPIENLQAFYKKFYRPDNVVLIVAGKFDEAKALALVQKYFGAIPRPTSKLTDTYTEEPPQDGERAVTVRRVGGNAALGVAYHIPSAAHPDMEALSLLGGILSQQPNGRLYKALVESKLASSAGARAGDNHDPGLFTVNVQVEPGQLEAARVALLDTLENLGKVPFTTEEVDRAKVRTKRNEERLFANAGALSQALSSASARGDWRLLFIQRDRIAAVTANDVNRVARTYFQKANRTVGMYIPQEKPERAVIAAAPPLEKLVKEYKGGTATAAGEAFDPTPENLDARTKIFDLDGIKVGLLPRKTRGDTVALLLTLHYGNVDSLKGQATAANMLPGLLLAGTKKHDRQALREELDRLGVTITPGAAGGGGRRGGPAPSTPGQLTFSVQAKRSTLPEAIKLLGEILREPAFPAEEFDAMKRRSRAGAEAARTEPTALASNRLSRTLSPYDPEDIRYVPTAEETIKRQQAVTLAQVIDIYKKQVGATAGELAIVGDFDPEPTLAAVRDILKDWRSQVAYQRIERTAPKYEPGHSNIVTPDKANAIFVAGLAFPLKDTDADFAALRLGNYIFGGDSLSSRIGVRIRQKEGLSYGASSAFNASARDPRAIFTVSAITNPANIDKVAAAFREELEKFLSNGPTPQELEDAKKGFLGSQRVGRNGDAAQAGQIANNLNLGRSFAFTSELEKRIKELTPDDIKTAFRKYIDPDKLVIVRAGDFK